MSNFLHQKQALKQTLKHTLALLLVITMLFGLGACTEQKPAQTESTPVVQEAETQALPTSTEPFESELITIERDLGPEPLRVANQATALALRYYIFARLITEDLVALDINALSEGALQNQMDELVKIWETADTLTSAAEVITDQAVLLLDTSQTDTFSQPSIALASYTAQVIDRQTWAENLTKQYDALRGAQRYKQLAEQLGTDTRTAVEQMALAQKIIHNAADLEEAQAEVDAYTDSIKIVEGYKTASKVGLFVGATIATGGGTLTALAGSSMSVPVAGAIIVGGVDCIVDVGQTTSSIILGEDHQVTVDFKEAADVIQPISMVMSLVTMDPTSAIDEIAFLGEAMMEWSNPGKVTGIAVEMTKNATSHVLAKLIGMMEGNLPDVRKSLEGLNLSLPKEEGTTLAKLILANTVSSEEAQEKMQELRAQMAKLAGEDVEQSPEVQETPAPDPEDGTLTGEQTQPAIGSDLGNSIAGTYSNSAVLQSTAEGVEADGSLPVTLQLNEGGTGTATVYGFSGDAVYAGSSVSFSVPMTGLTCAFEGTASRSGSSVVISGTMVCTLMGIAAATYSWTAQK
ncbi:MAG: hypothetical protein PHW11_09735 [Anaerolineaceae bacterium]|jgi:hypothetical protein|nr:hypothetical protein [Anaerolineaceae bacterium]MDD4043383.1 hypothetical protein [Anaerolineaceae bacterium]MDD4578473.1 hypothetical protein [Anaerolineaceae bacterium]